MNDNHIIFQQLFDAESSTYTYLIADSHSKEAALIDPVKEMVSRDLSLVKELGLNLKYVLDTHIHADHITGAGEIRELTKAQTGISQNAGVDCVDLHLVDGQILNLGVQSIKVITTPGHTNTCLSFYFVDRIFTGDALLIRGTGRTDFQEGSAEKLFDSITNKIFKLPEETLIYPGHDYKGFTSSTVALEKRYNIRVGGGRSKQEFIKIMSELKLAHPKKIQQAVPANLSCGILKGNEN